ncbi:hypothetical protein [Enterobacter hormaechei]|uniref:hypothetical protein n=1 Tax=Enterobacter hormaechei TaxID=158836 RepID=UPI003D368209
MNENYRVLKDVLDAAFKQASEGKGAERHGQDGSLDFMEQPMMAISSLLNTDGGLAYQAIKKITEARGMKEFARQERELLGAINYIAGMIMHLRRIDSMRRADADFDNAAQQFESLTGCQSREQTESKLKWSIGIDLTTLPPEQVEAFRKAVDSYCVAGVEPRIRPGKITIRPDMADRHRNNPAYVASYWKIISMKRGMSETRSLIAELNRSFDENQETDQNAPKVAPVTESINEDVIIMVNKLQSIMVDAPEADYANDVAVIVNAGDYWENGNRHPELYARRFVDVVKSQAMMHPNKTVMAKMIGYHNGYTLNITNQRDYILELLDKGGMFTVSTDSPCSNTLRVVYNH